MPQNTPKYFHYFLTCVLFDYAVLFVLFYFFLNTPETLLILALWGVANVLNYPRLASRRYISYYKLFTLTIKQLLTFFALFALLDLVFDTIFVIPDLITVLWITFVFITRVIFVFVLRFYRIKGKGYNRFVIIGNTPTMETLTKQFTSKKSYGHILEKQFDKSDIAAIEALILTRQPNEIYCSSLKVSQDDIAQLLSLSFKYGINVHVVSDNSEAEKETDSFNEIALEFAELGLQDYPLIDPKNLLIKRTFDILFSTIIILTVLSWLVPILGLIIRLESSGPIFFKQPRAGRNGKYFMCIKFRSMKNNADDKQASKNDPRITKVGKIIRKLSIDEFPQFLNVLRGQMSVVGPRPHIKDLNDKYDKEINNYNDRILVKPGITGLSQITGHRGETVAAGSMANRIKIDILYVRNWRLYLDLVIISKTIIDVLLNRSKNAY